MSIRRPVIAINTSPQLALFPGEEAIPPAVAPTPSRGVRFQRPDPRELFVCGVRLDTDHDGHGSTRGPRPPGVVTGAGLGTFRGLV